MSAVLVTGGAGFIGANFVRYWHAHYPKDKLVVLDLLTYAGRKENIEPLLASDQVTFVQGDICDYEQVLRLMREYNIQTVVHFAAESHVDRSIEGPDVFIQTNIIGTHQLLKAARQFWLTEQKGSRPRFHHVSTDEVYGDLEVDDPPFTEETPYAPSSPYSASKASSDHLVRAYHRTYGLPVTISNCSNNYGPYQHAEKLVPKVIASILNNQPITVYGTGEQIRDWLYVEDHCVAIDLVLKKGVEGETYNIGGENEWTNVALIHYLCDVLDKRFQQDSALAEQYPDSPARRMASKSLITHVADRAGHDRRYAINPAKLRGLADARLRPFQEGIETTLDHYLACWSDIHE